MQSEMEHGIHNGIHYGTHTITKHWGIQGGPGTGTPPLRSNCFHFHVAFEKFWLNNTLVLPTLVVDTPISEGIDLP